MFAYAASLPKNTSAFISTALGWNHLQNHSGSETIDKVKAVVKTIFCILTLGIPLLVLKMAQIQQQDLEAEALDQIERTKGKELKDRIPDYCAIVELTLKTSHNALASKAFDLMCSDLQEDSTDKNLYLSRCRDSAQKYGDQALYNRANNKMPRSGVIEIL
jgi:hypothetical protein